MNHQSMKLFKNKKHLEKNKIIKNKHYINTKKRLI